MKKRIARALLRLTGWAPEGELPEDPKAVVVAAPHTSNWDGYYIILMGFALGAKFAWIGKESLFRWPLGGLLRLLNGIPIDRKGKLDLVAQLAREFERRDALLLAIAPEGTRSLRPHWKSGFYHIARTAKVPIIMGYLDYGRRRGGLGPTLHPTGDPVADMEEIRAFYSTITPKIAKNYGPIRLKDEAER